MEPDTTDSPSGRGPESSYSPSGRGPESSCNPSGRGSESSCNPSGRGPKLENKNGRTKPVEHVGDKFVHAFSGVISAFGTERNLRIQTCAAVLALVLCLVLRVEVWGWIAVIIMVALVIFAELFNTAVETVVDLVSPGYHELAKRAKDIAAGAVLISSVFSVIVGAIVYIDAIMRLLA